MAAKLHLQKLSVGTESVSDLAEWQAMRQAQTGALPCHVTRMWPKREAELLDGGSIYWVFNGTYQCRQRIVGLDEAIGADGIRRCAIVLEPGLIRVTQSPKRPFQGWRYLKPEDAPRDLPMGREDEAELPEDLSAALAELGVL